MSGGSRIARLLYQASRKYHAPAVATAPWKAGDATIRLNDGISTCSAHRPARAVGVEQTVRMDDEIAHTVPWIKLRAGFMQTRRGGRAANRSACRGGRNRRQSARRARHAGHYIAAAGRQNR